MAKQIDLANLSPEQRRQLLAALGAQEPSSSDQEEEPTFGRSKMWWLVPAGTYRGRISGKRVISTQYGKRLAWEITLDAPKGGWPADKPADVAATVDYVTGMDFNELSNLNKLCIAILGHAPETDGEIATFNASKGEALYHGDLFVQVAHKTEGQNTRARVENLMGCDEGW